MLAVQARRPQTPDPEGPFAIEAQRALGLRMMAALGYDFERGRLDVSTHPFCGGADNDVRITTRYDEADFAKALIDEGATEVSAYISHGVLSGPAVQRVTDGPLKELVITDSIEQPHEVLTCGKIRTVSVAPLIGEAIRRIANEESVSKLFD